MRYGFINNFSQLLAADLAAGATTMTLDGGGTDLSAASADFVYTLTLDDGEGTTEIVHVTGQTTNTLTIVRAQEGTTDQAWPTGTTVEMRVTAGIMGGAVLTTTDNNTIGLGASVTGATNAVVLGSSSSASAANTVALGPSASASANSGVAVGVSADASGDFSTALGNYAIANTENSIAIGYASAYGVEAIAVGGSSSADGSQSLAIGKSSNASSDGAVAIGGSAQVFSAGGIGLGSKARVSVPGGLRATGVPYLVFTALNGITVGTEPKIVYYTSSQVSIQSDKIDLTDGTAAVTLDLPTGTRLFMDSIDVIITGSNTPGGTPQITVGPDDVTPATYLAATTVSKTVVGERETHTPLVSDGVTSLRVAVSTAGTGTTYQAKVVFRGYVMEL